MGVSHPLTGVNLNVIEYERTSLEYAEAVTAHVMRMQGEKFSRIAHALGTNTLRVGEVLRGERHPTAIEVAKQLVVGSAPKPDDV